MAHTSCWTRHLTGALILQLILAGARRPPTWPWTDFTLPSNEEGIHRIALTDGSKDAIVALVRKIRIKQPDYSVLDIGAIGNPWTIFTGIADVIFDFTAKTYAPCFGYYTSGPVLEEDDLGKQCCAKPNTGCFDKEFTYERCCRGKKPTTMKSFNGDVLNGRDWKELLRYVHIHGKFDLVITSHLLEDVINPMFLAEMLPVVAKAGFVALPSKYHELWRGTPSPDQDNIVQMRGAIHHRWVFTVEQGSLLAVPKLPVLDLDRTYDPLERLGQNQSTKDLHLLWRGNLPMKVLNKGFMGPSEAAVVQMLRRALGPSAFDDVDMARLTGLGIKSYTARTR
eukprot:TRINITY_DN94779_c0_g1_i1.p1 TRINITY_DN94779_c0_g1~~TRINITY_DN94779_c0_g1_i1.p1  ORF type:complete len:338 (-),score=45.83 TRINITY_DN94779_c0_g1_i1:23-1036(-)